MNEVGLPSGPGVVRRGDVVDQFSTEEGAVVLVRVGAGHQLVRLSSLGAAILELVADGLDMEVLTGALLDRFGPPEGEAPETVLAAHVADLAKQHVIVVAES